MTARRDSLTDPSSAQILTPEQLRHAARTVCDRLHGPVRWNPATGVAVTSQAARDDRALLLQTLGLVPTPPAPPRQKTKKVGVA